MNQEAFELSQLAEQTVSVMRCPECLGTIFGLGCKTEIWGADRIKFKLGMMCSCGFCMWNDEYHDSFEDALNKLHEERVRISIDRHGILNYGPGGFLSEESYPHPPSSGEKTR